MAFKVTRPDEIIKGESIDRKIPDVKTESRDTPVGNLQVADPAKPTQAPLLQGLWEVVPNRGRAKERSQSIRASQRLPPWAQGSLGREQSSSWGPGHGERKGRAWEGSRRKSCWK